jgi:hypothetical protein
MFGVQRPSGGGGWQPPSPEQLQLSFPQYEIRDIAGCGGMGAVYKAWHKRLERFVALKILPSQIDDGGMDFVERFKQEAAAMAKFKHPGIVAVYDAGETPDGLLYFAMEFMEGPDLAKLVAQQGRLPVAQALGIAIRVCEALAYAHERGVVHRDIKPSNVMIEPDGTVKVADFGLAKLSGVETHVSTGSGLSIGTPDFMPPEALQGSQHVDHRGDIYATGGLLYQMLTGKAPHGRFAPPSMVITGLDKRLDAVVDKAMQHDREKRYASATEFLADLTRIAATLKQPAGGTIKNPAGPRYRVAVRLVMIGLVVSAILGAYSIAIGRWGKINTGMTAGDNRQAAPAVTKADRREWKPAPSKFNAVFDRGSIHLERFDSWGTGEIQRTNVAVRSTIAWQPSPPGRNELIKVTARWTDEGHYYACLYGPNVELGYYRSSTVTPLQRWPIEPPPGPDEAVPLQLACVGHHLAVWVRDRLVGVFDDDTVPGPGKVGVQAIDGHMRSLDYLDLDGLADAAAFQRLGLDATGTSAIPFRDWVNLFPDLAKLPEIADFKDGWARLSDKEGIKHLSDVDGKILAAHNGGLRAKRRVPEGWHGGVVLHVRSLEGGRRLNLCYYEPKAPGEKAYLQIRHYQPEALPANATAEQAWGAQKLVAEERIPPVSGEITTELVVVGGTVRGRFGDHIVTAAVEDDGKAGRMALDEASAVSFRDVAVLKLDSLPEADALKSAGMQTAPGKSGANAPGMTSTIAPWHDALAESPMKDVIEKAAHTAQGYRLPENNHWVISPQAQRSGAVRVRAAGVNAQFISLFALFDDRQAERLRFRDASKEWRLSNGQIGVGETDFASTAGASPSDGQPHELLFARVGGRVRAMLDGHLFLDEPDPSSLRGRFVVDVYRRATVWVQKVEYVELDDVPASEALKLIGMDSGGKELPAATGVPPVIAPANARKTEPWVDLLRPDAAAKLELDGTEKAGPEGLVLSAQGKATVARTAGIGTSDGALRFRARFEPVTVSRVSIRARATEGAGYGLVVVNPSRVALRIWHQSGIGDILKEFQVHHPLQPGQDYEMELRAVGSTLTVRVNGETMGQVEDTTFPLGAFQIRAGTGEAATIRALEYLDLSASASAGATAVVRPPEGDFATATKEKPFVNSLGMKFVPVPITGGPTGGKRVLFSIWETRVQDYEVFAKETQRAWPKPGFEQGPTHPAVDVTWPDAKAFCEWLTERDRKDGRVSATQRYRLPTDHEWSCAAGIGEREDPMRTAKEKHRKIADVFPWGGEWPPSPGTGNFSGEESSGAANPGGRMILTGYRDDFVSTAPVGTFSADRLGLFDLAGNVREWCEDRWSDGEAWRVSRGGAFNSGGLPELLSSDRTQIGEAILRADIGIRPVLEDVSSAPAAASAGTDAKRVTE